MTHTVRAVAGAAYDRIGVNYARYRRPDPRIEQALARALGAARSVVNVGAGSGSYEPRERAVVAVEPSEVMVRQRPPGAAPVVRASAEQLPFADGSFDAALAILTVHHWADRRAGLREMLRVARERVVLLTWDPSYTGFWLVDDYFPELLAYDCKILPSLDELASVLGPLEVTSVPIPHDCSDGFLGAYWRRPLAYLDDGARSAISSFARISGVDARLAKLRADVESGRWAQRNAALLGLSELDLGYRIVVASALQP